jgi:hypothetical protein
MRENRGETPEMGEVGQGKPLLYPQGETPRDALSAVGDATEAAGEPGEAGETGEGGVPGEDWLTPDAAGEARGEAAVQRLGNTRKMREYHSPADFSRAARRKLVLELRCQWPPMGIRQIAEKLGITRNMVWDDLQALKQMHADIIDGRDTAAMVGETMDLWEMIVGKALRLVDTYSNPLAKAAMLRVAGTGLENRMALLREAGLLDQMAKSIDTLGRLPGVPGARPEPGHNQVYSVREKVAMMKAQLREQTGITPGPVVEAVVEPPAWAGKAASTAPAGQEAAG